MTVEKSMTRIILKIIHSVHLFTTPWKFVSHYIGEWSSLTEVDKTILHYRDRHPSQAKRKERTQQIKIGESIQMIEITHKWKQKGIFVLSAVVFWTH